MFGVEREEAAFQTERLDQFRIGDELPNNGALVITDSDTDATILWVITEET